MLNLNLLRSWWDLALRQKGSTTLDEEELAVTFITTLCRGVRDVGYGEDAYANETMDRATRFRRWKAIWGTPADDQLTCLATLIGSNPCCSIFPYDDFIEDIADMTFGLTESGLMVLLPQSSTSTDLIVIFAGSRTPSIVREDGGTFILIGPCYVEDLARGEAFPSDVDELDWITLR